MAAHHFSSTPLPPERPTPMYQPMTNHLPDPDLNAEFYADVPLKRALAWVVDTLFIAIITLLIVPFTAFTALFFLPFLFLVVSFIYRSISLANRSATPGMRLMAIEFRTSGGERFGLGTALVHTLAYTVSISMVLPQILSVILMATSARAQGLTDLVLGTVAINRAAGQ